MDSKDTFVTLRPEGRRLRARLGTPLAEAIGAAGIPLDVSCSRRGLCGRCAVRVVSGRLEPPDEEEAAGLRRRGYPADYRLACRVAVQGPLTIEIPAGSLLRDVSVLDRGSAATVALAPAVRRFPCRVERPTLGAPDAWLDRLAAVLGRRDVPADAALLRELPAALHAAGGEVTVTIYRDREILDVSPGDAGDRCLGVAVDIGTSTVVLDLVDLSTGETLSRAAAINAQASYGADVVSRLTYAFHDTDRLSKLQAAIVDLLNDMIRETAAEAGAAPEDVFEVVAAGNTAMSHFLLGVPVDGLAMAPFHGVFSSLPPLRASEAGLAVHPSGRLWLAPNIRSFVGGDISAGLSAADVSRRGGNILFLDLGTNGEIVLKKGNRFLATSTAAGPAFEGMSVSCGMLAVSGAVARVEWNDGFELSALGDKPAAGLCGTGLIDALAVALEHGLLRPDGRIASGEDALRLAPGIALTQADVRELQLAVAAVRSGVRLMLAAGGLPLSKVDRVLVAGAFGNELDVRNGMAIGLLPTVPVERCEFLGNSSLAGARKLLLSAPERAALERLAGRVRHVSLASEPGFQDVFVQSMAFRPYTGE